MNKHPIALIYVQIGFVSMDIVQFNIIQHLNSHITVYTVYQL